MDWAKAHFPSPTPSSHQAEREWAERTDAERSGESPDAAALWQHAEEDRDPAVVSGICGPQSAADFGNERGGNEV
jgi:hypothetical protein